MKNQFPCWQDIALPLILLLTGLTLVGGDWAGVLSLDRIANLWPCAVFMIGLAMLGSDSSRRRQSR